METLLFYALINSLCIAILTLLIIMGSKTDDGRTSHLLTWVLFSACLFFAFDFGWEFMIQSDYESVFLNKALDVLYFAASTICAYLWAIYTEKMLGKGPLDRKYGLLLFSVPIVIFIAILLASCKTGWIFSVSSDNVYSRGPLHFLHPFTNCLYLAFSSIHCALAASKEKIKSNRSKYIALSSFIIFPLICGILEIVVDGPPFLCVGMTLSFVYAYVNIEHETNRNQAEVINALTDDYENILLVDLSRGKVIDYRSGFILEQLKNTFGYTDSFSERITHLGDMVMRDEDKKDLYLQMSTQHLVRELDRHGEIIVDTKFMLESGPEYYQIKAVAVDDFKTTQTAIIGIRNVDETMRHEISQRMQLEEARSKAESASHAKSTFLFNMSHDIRTPMNAIIGFTEIARKHTDDPERVKGYLEKIDISGQHLLKLINDVLDMARIESGKVSIVEVPARIHGFGDAALAMTGMLADERHVDLDIKYISIKNEDIYADILHLDQIILNVVINAIKYTSPGGRVFMSIEQVRSKTIGCGSYVVVIEDNGVGMSPDFLNHIFDYFERERSSTVSGIQGTGIGMSIVKNLVDLMGGKIKVESTPNVGTKVTLNFTFRLRSVSDVEEQESPKIVSNSDAWKLKKPVDLRDRRALIVEDNDLNREILKDILLDEGMIIDEAVDGEEAVKKVSESDPGDYDFVLMDIQMPKLDGYEATKAIRNLDRKGLTDIPIIAMTANAFEEDKQRSVEAGMNAHLAKPVDTSILLSTISKFIKY